MESVHTPAAGRMFRASSFACLAVMSMAAAVRAGDPVTGLDKAVDALIASHLDRLYPGHQIQPGGGTDDWAVLTRARGVIGPSRFAQLPPAHQLAAAGLVEMNRINGAPVMGLCFSPDTPPKIVEAFELASMGIPGRDYRAASRWSFAATAQPGPLTQGQPTTLTYSYAPDGTTITASYPALGEVTGPSNLFAIFNANFPSQATWQSQITAVFTRWSQITGLQFVLEPNDDSAGISGASPSGLLGTRGDIRISGHTIDGGGAGILAYNYYPNNGDMVIDTANFSFYINSSNSYRAMRNTLAHENGHGVGMAHVCPSNATKLMEPFISTGYDGPQHDDILLGTRHYGDPYERVLPNNNNDTAATDWFLGVLGNGTTNYQGGGIDDNSDTDYYGFTVAALKRVQITLTPVGATYLEGAQNGDGSCSAGTNFNSLIIHNLSVQLIGIDGTTVIASANNGGAGSPDTIAPINFPAGLPGTYFVRVVPDATDNVQMYDFSITITDFVNSASDSEVFD